MYKELFFLVLGFGIGTYLGFIIQGLILRPTIGDDFEINKPKIKGENNKLEVNQENLLRKIFTRKNKNNGNKESS